MMFLHKNLDIVNIKELNAIRKFAEFLKENA
jgi:hypothetical protein